MAPSTLEAEHALLVAATRDAGAMALDYFRRGVKSWDKETDGTPVSEADLAVDTLLRERLTGARPDYGWLSEETEDDRTRLSAKRVWIVDPIDGTRAFLKNIPEFTVCAALVEDGATIAAAVFNPAKDEFFEATLGGGARLNGQAMTASDQTDVKTAHFLASRRTLESQFWPWAPEDINSTWMNSIAYRMVLVGAGRYDAALSFNGKSDWDIAAADLIVREAGCRNTTMDGGSFTFNRPATRHPNLVTAAPGLYDAVCELLD